LPPGHPETLYSAANIGDLCHSEIGDVGARARLEAAVQDSRPQIVIHMAAQALVRRSIANPVGTFATNVLGTVNLLDTLRSVEELTDVLVVTSDKVYRNRGESGLMDESTALGGADPYSASKAACEHVAHSFAATYFTAKGIRLATARGGNVIGGGDRSEDRIILDCVRSLELGQPVLLRNPDAVRPWQHVLDCVNGYLIYVERLAGAPIGCPRSTSARLPASSSAFASWCPFSLKPSAVLPAWSMARVRTTSKRKRCCWTAHVPDRASDGAASCRSTTP
jgi:CDP-glucose 4,6-dehydratase